MIHPVRNVGGRLTYRASYPANLDQPRTAPPGEVFPAPIPKSMIGLEFDLTTPGHPLVKVYIPDPMS